MAKSPTVEDVARVAGVSRQTVSNVLNTPGDRQGVHARARRVGHRRARLSPARRRADAAHAAQLDHRHPSRSVRRRHLGRRARSVRPRPHRAGERARACAMLVYAARTPEEEIARLAELTERRRDRRRRHHGHLPRRPAHRLAERARAAVRLVRPAVGRGRRRRSPSHPWVDVDGAAGTRAATEHALVDRRTARRVPRLAVRIGHGRRPGARLARGDGDAARRGPGPR